MSTSPKLHTKSCQRHQPRNEPSTPILTLNLGFLEHMPSLRDSSFCGDETLKCPKPSKGGSASERWPQLGLPLRRADRGHQPPSPGPSVDQGGSFLKKTCFRPRLCNDSRMEACENTAFPIQRFVICGLLKFRELGWVMLHSLYSCQPTPPKYSNSQSAEASIKHGACYEAVPKRFSGRTVTP